MKAHELKPAAGSHRRRRRVGRGISSGQGKTSGRGQKGQGARSGFGMNKGFVGGHMPLTQRIPKLRGFTNRNRREFAIVNVGKLNRFDGKSLVDGQALAGVGLVAHAGDSIKILGAGKLKVPVTVRVHRISAAARAAVEAAGGGVELLEAVEVDKEATAAPAAPDE
ncbi:MAG: 50S ribosomal protein L15 [Candidatus Dormibacteria bacterium]